MLQSSSKGGFMALWLIITAPVWLPLLAFIGVHTHDTWIGGRP
jgi:hypothetical protein